MVTWYQTAEYFKGVAGMASEIAKNPAIPMTVRKDAMAAETALQRLAIDIQAELHHRIDTPTPPALPWASATHISSPGEPPAIHISDPKKG